MFCKLKNVSGSVFVCTNGGCCRTIKIEHAKHSDKRFCTIPCRGSSEHRAAEDCIELAKLMGDVEVNDGGSIGGVGSQLGDLLAAIGISPEGCNCHETKTKMNRLGPAGCREQLDELCDEIRANASSWGIAKHATRIAAAVPRLIASGIAVDPLHPIRSLVLEAIRRAEAAENA